MKEILQTRRLRLREMIKADFQNLCTILQDEKAMYAYEHAFSDEEVRDWLERQLERYRRDGFGLWVVERKDTGEFVGQAGLTWQETGRGQEIEIGYLFKRSAWHNGYATEAARGCKRYAFEQLGASRVVSIIRETNHASQQVARRLGMKPIGKMVKHYYHMDMPHLVFALEKEEADGVSEL